MSDETTAAPLDPEIPDPRDREVPGGARGTPVQFGGGEWLLADYVPRLSPVWDTLFDDMLFGRGFEPGDVMAAAQHLLHENYDLTAAESFALLLGIDPKDLIPAVMLALRGEGQEQYRSSRTWGQWQEFSLRLAGIAPDTFPARKRRQFVDFLVAAGVAPPAYRWVGSAATIARRTKREAE